MDELVAAVRESLAESTRERFDSRVRAQGSDLAADVRAGRYDSPGFALGLELESTVVGPDGRPVRAPDACFDVVGCGGELGLQNVELHTDPDEFTPTGLERQADELARTAGAVRDVLAGEGGRGDPDRSLGMDAMWAVPPAEGTREYVAAATERDGVRVADNMRRVDRYVAIDNDILRRVGGSVSIGLADVDSVPSILFESLATSIQPHLQIPDASDLPAYRNAAVRTMGPLLSLTANSPFLPADCYADTGVEAAFSLPHELRVPVFERSVNDGLAGGREKCRVPADIETTTEAVDRVVADTTYAPVLVDPDEAEGPYPEFDVKRGTYWRWVRAVFGGSIPRSDDGDVAGSTERSVRIEYRPLPAQPTVRDTVAVQALTGGLVRGLVAADHPLTDLPWSAARDAFYAAVADGPGADLAWVTAGGDRTDDVDRIYDEVFEFAERGLVASGFDPATAREVLEPVAARRATRTTPSAWKRERVRDRLDGGADLHEAIVETQREYAQLAAAHDSFADWL
jgi:hypothetical protein